MAFSRVAVYGLSNSSRMSTGGLGKHRPVSIGAHRPQDKTVKKAIMVKEVFTGGEPPYQGEKSLG